MDINNPINDSVISDKEENIKKLLCNESVRLSSGKLVRIAVFLSMGGIIGILPPMIFTADIAHCLYGKFHELFSVKSVIYVMICIAINFWSFITIFFASSHITSSKKNEEWNSFFYNWRFRRSYTLLKVSFAGMLAIPLFCIFVCPKLPVIIISAIYEIFTILNLYNIFAIYFADSDGSIKPLSYISAFLSFAHSGLCVYSIFRLSSYLSFLHIIIIAVLSVLLLMLSASILLFGIFILKYNKRIKELKAELETA